jgi:hypothetical protein
VSIFRYPIYCLLPVCLVVAGCGNRVTLPTGSTVTIPGRLSGNLPASGPIIPNTTLQLTPSTSIPLEKIVSWGAYLGVAYLILDPWAPNWQIEEAPLGDKHIHFSMKMKRYYAGGAGEARLLFHRRAKELMEYNGFDGYEVVEFSEGMESSVLGSMRTAEGVVRFTKKAG